MNCGGQQLKSRDFEMFKLDPQRRASRKVATIVVITNLVTLAFAIVIALIWIQFNRRSWANRMILREEMNAYALINISSEIRLHNHDKALDLSDSAIAEAADSIDRLWHSDGADPQMLSGTLRVLVTYDQIANVLGEGPRQSFGAFKQFSQKDVFEMHCDVGICRLVKNQPIEAIYPN